MEFVGDGNFASPCSVLGQTDAVHRGAVFDPERSRMHPGIVNRGQPSHTNHGESARSGTCRRRAWKFIAEPGGRINLTVIRCVVRRTAAPPSLISPPRPHRPLPPPVPAGGYDPRSQGDRVLETPGYTLRQIPR